MKYKIKIVKNGPYIVTGNVPLSEKIIIPIGNGYEYREGRPLPQAEVYTLCRCGKSKTPPFCDGNHISCKFIGEETASRETFMERADLIEGKIIDMMDDHRCAMARFCHREAGDAWELVENAETQTLKKEAIKAACECPTGRLVAMEKSGDMIEPDYDPAIEILQDAELNVSCGIFVKGAIPLVSSDGSAYETRNRIVLCRCGASENKPFCDAVHINVQYKA